MAFASNKDLHHMISTGGIINLPVTNIDSRHADEIWCPSIAILKGKSKAKAAAVYRDIVVDKSIVQSQSMYSDLFFVEQEAFLISVTEPLSTVQVTHLKGKTATILWNAFQCQINALKAEGFEVKDLFIDQEGAVAKIREKFQEAGIRVHSYVTKVAIVERKISTLKGRIRSVIMSLPFPLCKKLLVMCVLYCALRLNQSPCNTRVDTTSPFENLVKRKLDWKRDLCIGFGDSAEVVPKETNNDVLL